MIVWMNLYAQGYYHRAGKPGTVEVHPGDLYPSREAALADIDPDAPYIETISADTHGWYGTYGSNSQPRPLRETRRDFETNGVVTALRYSVPSQIAGLRPLTPAWSLEVGEDYTPMTMEQVKAAIEAEPALPVIRPAMLDEVQHQRSLAEGSTL